MEIHTRTISLEQISFVCNLPCSPDVRKYEIISVVGQGSFGKVYKARTGDKFVALKKILKNSSNEQIPITTLREVQILRSLQHENVVKLLEVCWSKRSGSAGTFHLVLEFCDHDLRALIRNPKVKFSLGEIKSVLQQLLRALHHVHANKVMHRDVKPENVLVTTQGVVKLADFGLARSLPQTMFHAKQFTNPVVTLHYRAPEVLLGDDRYGRAVDMWSFGCIVGEMWKRKPILRGTSEQSQLLLVIELCGSIVPEVWPGVENYRLYNVLVLPEHKERRIRECFGQLMGNEHACDLLDKSLVLDPSRRITASSALNSDFFWTEPMPSNLSYLTRYHSEVTIGESSKINDSSCPVYF